MVCFGALNFLEVEKLKIFSESQQRKIFKIFYQYRQCREKRKVFQVLKAAYLFFPKILKITVRDRP